MHRRRFIAVFCVCVIIFHCFMGDFNGVRSGRQASFPTDFLKHTLYTFRHWADLLTVSFANLKCCPCGLLPDKAGGFDLTCMML